MNHNHNPMAATTMHYPSNLRVSTTPADYAVQPSVYSRSSSTSPRPEKRRRMTVTQTYFLAHTARGKLSSEASRGDHNLRLLVGHANLLDALTLDLQEAEREQDAWFESTVAETRKASDPKRVQWSDRVAAAYEQQQQQDDVDIPDASDDEEDSDADSDSGLYNESLPKTQPRPSRRAPSPMLMDIDEEDEDMYADEESDNNELQLVRTTSRSAQQPPELVHDHSDSSDSEDEEEEAESPITPPEAAFPLPQDIKTKDFASAEPSIAQRVVAAY